MSNDLFNALAYCLAMLLFAMPSPWYRRGLAMTCWQNAFGRDFAMPWPWPSHGFEIICHVLAVPLPCLGYGCCATVVLWLRHALVIGWPRAPVRPCSLVGVGP